MEDDMPRIVEMKNILFDNERASNLFPELFGVKNQVWKVIKKKKNNFRNCIIFDKTIFVFAQNRFDRTETYLFLEGINGISYRYIVGRQIRGEIIGLKRNILAERFIGIYCCGNGIGRSYIRKIITGKWKIS